MLYVLISWVTSHIRSEKGQDLLEYAMLGGLIAAAIVAVLALGVMTGAISGMASGIANCIDFNSGTACSPGF
jgi:Flp pilus assembly pilin Flp